MSPLSRCHVLLPQGCDQYRRETNGFLPHLNMKSKSSGLRKISSSFILQQKVVTPNWTTMKIKTIFRYMIYNRILSSSPKCILGSTSIPSNVTFRYGGWASPSGVTWFSFLSLQLYIKSRSPHGRNAKWVAINCYISLTKTTLIGQKRKQSSSL